MTKSVLNKAIADPLRVFDSPREVVDAPNLSVDEKIKILRNWELDARRLLESAEENMTDERGRERDQIPEIHRALRELGENPASAPR